MTGMRHANAKTSFVNIINCSFICAAPFNASRLVVGSSQLGVRVSARHGANLHARFAAVAAPADDDFGFGG